VVVVVVVVVVGIAQLCIRANNHRLGCHLGQ